MYTAEGVFPGVKMLMGQSLLERIKGGRRVEVGTWQSQDVKGSDWGATYELQNAIFEVPLPGTAREAQIVTGCNMPWAEEHFEERVSGIPYNPPPSAKNWPYAKNDHKEVTTDDGKFSHTYPERFWPKLAGIKELPNTPLEIPPGGPIEGIRFSYGDLEDVVKLLAKSPGTRQAYLPIWFPEDAGVVHGERVPCTLGYHFLIRENRLSITYFIRSCDFLRHFSDDVYMAMRLAQWVRQVTRPDEQTPRLGTLTMHMCSLHVFEGDRQIMEARYGKA